MQKEDEQQMAQSVEQMLGGPAPEEQQETTAAGAPPAEQGSPPQPSLDGTAKDSPSEQAASEGAPKTEGSKMKEPPVTYKVPFSDGNEREYNAAQIEGVMTRYRDMNYKNMQMKPVMDVVETILRENPNLTPDKVAKIMSGEGGNNSNPAVDTSTAPAEKAPAKSKLSEKDLTDWEEANAIKLPPGYKEMMNAPAADNSGEMAQIKQLLQTVLAQAQGSTEAARTGLQAGEAQQSENIRNQIANTLETVANHLKLPNEKQGEFLDFAYERGLTANDFLDPQMVVNIMSDFINGQNANSFDRFRSMAEKRQGFSGSLGSSSPSATPAGSTQNQQATPESKVFDTFVDDIVNERKQKTMM